jgi:hypothetical protein
MSRSSSLHPKLIEPGVKYFLGETLLNCKKTKFEFYNRLINWSLFLGFVSAFGVWLYHNYKEKIRKMDSRENEKNQQYILEMVKKYQAEKKEEEKNIYRYKEMITDLPEFEADIHMPHMRANTSSLNELSSQPQPEGTLLSETEHAMKVFL